MALLSRAHALMKDNFGAAIVSALIGLGIASLFRKACVGDVCKVYVAPDPKTVEGQQFRFDGSCYEYTQEDVSCDAAMGATYRAKEDPAALIQVRADPLAAISGH